LYPEKQLDWADVVHTMYGGTDRMRNVHDLLHYRAIVAGGQEARDRQHINNVVTRCRF